MKVPEIAWRYPNHVLAPEFQADGVKAVFFDGLPWKGKPTRVFAWVGVPKLEPGKKAPGIVLVHGGGGTAFADWVRLWVSRGYAAIAMDTCGCVPKGSYGKWERHDDGGPPGWGEFEHADEPMEDQWPYHAVTDVIIAHILLRGCGSVDPERIGITGISWGGYLTCIVSGLDDRFRFAVPVYGCGFLGDDSAWVPEVQKAGLKGGSLARDVGPVPLSQERQDAQALGDRHQRFRLPARLAPEIVQAGRRLEHACASACECRTATTARARIRPRSWRLQTPSSVRTRRSPRSRQPAGTANRVWARFRSATRIQNAELLYTEDDGTWNKRRWQTSAATIDEPASTVERRLFRAAATVYYLNLTDDRKLIVSTEHQETARESQRQGVRRLSLRPPAPHQFQAVHASVPRVPGRRRRRESPDRSKRAQP